MGIDIGVVSGQPGAPIYAAYEGVVTDAGYSEQGGYGRRVVIEHERGQYKTLYAHLQKVMVNIGDYVTTGHWIGTMGGNIEDKNRGASGGTHLHFEVILRDPVPGSIRTSRGYCVDPIPYLMQRYFPAPVNAIQVTSVKGLRVRSKSDVTSTSIHNLFLKDIVNVMEVLPGTVTEKWVRLWSLREEYCAIKFNGQVNAVLVAAETVEVTPLPTPELVPQNTVDAFVEGFSSAVQKVREFLDTLPKEGK